MKPTTVVLGFGEDGFWRLGLGFGERIWRWFRLETTAEGKRGDDQNEGQGWW